MFPFEKLFLVIGKPVFDDPTKLTPDFGKALEAVAANQGISFGETGLYSPFHFPDSTEPHFEYRLFKGKTASSEYEPIQFDYFPTESTLRVYSNIPESKAMPIVDFIANNYLGVLLQERENTLAKTIVQCRCMTPCIKRFEMIADILVDAVTHCLETGDYDIQNKWWMKAGLELLSQRPKSPDKTQKGPMRIGFNYPDSVRIAIAARKLYESLYAWISECHPEQLDTYHRDYNSLAGQALDIFEKLSSEEDWVYCLFTLNESPTGEQYNIYNPKPFTILRNICDKPAPAQIEAEVQMNVSITRDVRYRGESNEDKIAEKLAAKLREQPLDARVVEVDPSAGKSLRAAMKDPGGRSKKTEGITKILKQHEMADAFGKPCNEDMISNWEAYERTGGKRGAMPFGFTKDNEKIIYSAELRTNPTPDNKKRLSALIAEFQSRHRLKTAIGEKAKTIHCRSAESLYQAQKKHGA